MNRTVLTRELDRMNGHVRRQHNATARSRRHGRPFYTGLTFTLFFLFGADDLIFLVGGAGDLHGSGHGLRGDGFFVGRI